MHGGGAGTATAAGRTRRAEDVLDMHRAARRGGTAHVLRWLAARTGAAVVLANGSGEVVSPLRPPLGDAARDLVLRAAREAAVRGARSVTIDEGELTCLVVPLGGPPSLGMPLLAAVAARPAPRDLSPLLADATSSLGLCWQAERTRRQQSRLRIADARTREAVLHMLLNDQVSAARHVAAALRPALPDVVRLYLIEGPPAKRGAAAESLAAAAAEGAWIVPCPVYADHLVLLEPADPEALADGFPQRSWPPSVTEACWIGVSDAVPLRDAATGYAQAFHALAAARQSAERHASFAGHPDLALTVGPAAARWAEAFLAPLLAHRARRPQDPDGRELLATAASWLSFSSRATAHLTIHRNTLTARLALIRELLGLDLNQLVHQAALALALRAHAARVQPGRGQSTAEPGGTTPCLDELLASPHVVAWAHRQFRPVRAPGVPAYIDQTLTTWLRSDARIGPTAAALSLTASAVRKRLTRSEALLERSLLRSPSAVHDQWLALRALDLAGQFPETASHAGR